MQISATVELKVNTDRSLWRLADAKALEDEIIMSTRVICNIFNKTSAAVTFRVDDLVEYTEIGDDNEPR